MKKKMSLNFNRIPEIVYEADHGFEEIYKFAWKLAFDHVRTCDALPVSPYMDEACNPARIWIWDTCFMVHFCKYSPDQFPGIESLDNFYRIMYDNFPVNRVHIHHPDNPPLFAWVEYEYFKFTGDYSRIRRNLVEKQYLIRHYDWLENQSRFAVKQPFAYMPSTFEKRDTGCLWSGCSSGMDNTPRGVDDAASLIYWVDALAQQALSALYIRKLAEVIGEDEISKRFEVEYQWKKELLDRYYFDEKDGVYYDIFIANGEHCRYLTPASFWVLLAEAAPTNRAKRQIETLRNDSKLGGDIPIPSVSRDSEVFEPDGHYWRGSVWIPTSYMVIKALEKYGEFDLAADLAERTLVHVKRVYQEFEPHTIWECYSPTKIAPAMNRCKNVLCRPDFCGWSALAPISMLIENILGLYEADAVNRVLKYHHRAIKGKHGVRNFRFGDVVCDFIVEGNHASIRSNVDFTLKTSEKNYAVKAGETAFFF